MLLSFFALTPGGLPLYLSCTALVGPASTGPLQTAHFVTEGFKSVKKNRLGLAMLALLTFALFATPAARAQQLNEKLQNAIGKWQVINSDGGLGGQVEVYLVDGQLFGKVTQLRPGRTPGDVCDRCSGELKDKLILGMVILKGFHPDGDDWVGGTVVDPENGKQYHGKIWSAGKDKLYMRGYIGISLLGRTESWKRIP